MSSPQVTKTRIQIGREELQPSPIFVLKRGYLSYDFELFQLLNGEDPSIDHDSEGVINKESGEYFTDEQLLAKGWAHIEWRVLDFAFLTREEAKRYVLRNSHHYGHGKAREHIDWQVECISCIGRLAEALRPLNNTILEPEVAEAQGGC